MLSNQRAHHSTTTTPRSPRLSFQGRVRLMVHVQPWRLLLTLRGLNLSSGGLCAQLHKAAFGSNQAESLLLNGDLYTVQLDPDGSHLPSPVLQARLVRRTQTNAGWELAFTFTPGDTTVTALLDELQEAQP